MLEADWSVMDCCRRSAVGDQAALNNPNSQSKNRVMAMEPDPPVAPRVPEHCRVISLNYSICMLPLEDSLNIFCGKASANRYSFYKNINYSRGDQ